MFSLPLKSLRANKARFLLTSVAVLLGVAFMAGTFVLTDTIQKSYDEIAGNVYRDTDAVVRSARSVESTGQQSTTTRGTVTAATLDTVRAVPGVQAAEAQQQGIAVVVGHDGRLLDANPNRAAPLAVAWQDTPAFNPLTIVSGHAPRAPDEIVIDQRSADTGRFVLDETVQVVTPTGSSPFRIAGIATYGGADDAAGAQVVAFTPDTASNEFGTPGRFDAIQVVAAPGVSQATVVENVRAALHDPDTEVITGEQAVAEAREASTAGLAFVSMFLLTCAIVALVVGSFVIYNTFSITVAHRTREIALLRAIGA